MSIDSGGAIMVDLIVTGGEAEVLRRLCAASGRSAEAELLHLLRHTRPPANGEVVYTLTCSGCGLPFQSKRRQLLGRRVWCADCKEAGEPAAQRARDYRGRKHERLMP